MRPGGWLAAIGVVVIAAILFADERPGWPRPLAAAATSGPALDEIRGEQIAAHLQFLSDDLLEGRAPSTRGGELAARYLAAQLALLGYEPAAADGSYYQQVAIVESTVNPSLTLTAGAGAAFKYLDDVVVFSGVQEPRVTATGDIVVYTSHYDHLGMRDPQPGEPPDTDRIYNGAAAFRELRRLSHRCSGRVANSDRAGRMSFTKPA